MEKIGEGGVMLCYVVQRWGERGRERHLYE